MRSPLRLFALAGLSAVVFAGLGLGVEWWTLGWSTDATVARLEAAVRETVAERIGEVDGLARRVAVERDLAEAAAQSPTRLPALFEKLRQLAEPTDRHEVAVTVYAPTGGTGVFRVLAWSDGPGEQDLSPTRLGGPSTLFVAPGHAGLRLLRVAPIERDGTRVAVAVAETVLAAVDRSSESTSRQLPTRFGPVTVIEQYASAREAMGPASGFVIESTPGEPLLEVLVDRDRLDALRTAWRRTTLALAALPLALALALLVAWPLAKRRVLSGAWPHWVQWTLVSGAVLLTAGALTIGLARLAQAPPDVVRGLGTLVAVGLVAVAGQAWWRPSRRRPVSGFLVWFGAEQLVAGLVLAGGLEWLARRAAAASAATASGSVLFPFSTPNLISFVSTLFEQLAVGWTVAVVIAWTSTRWRRTGATVAVRLALWTLPAIALAAFSTATIADTPRAALVAMSVAVVFGLAAQDIRHRFCRATPSLRLAFVFAAIALPLVAFYPLSAERADRETRIRIAGEYATQTANHKREFLAELARAQVEIDRFPRLESLVGDSCGPVDSSAAFLLWSRTNLSRSRVISDIELYRADGCLVSRFAFNLPEYLSRSTDERRERTACSWEGAVFGEVRSFGSAERRLLHAERDICDNTGQLLGGVVVHVAAHANDYQSLPFVEASGVYGAALGRPDALANRTPVSDVALAVYGWGERALFTSGNANWPLDQATVDRLYRSGEAFWTTLVSGGRTMAVHFSQDRGGIYALGYPMPTVLDHAERVSELLALCAVLFVALQLGGLVYAWGAARQTAPLRAVLHEIRTSFYRKLFLAFVAAAVVPVVVAAIAFGAYMSARFTADVEREAITAVTTARSVFEELMATDRVSLGANTPTDDMMVWIRQVTDQDVNYYEGPELVATSQRDLFDSGLLPTRTPAPVYRGVAIERRPTLVAEDRLGTLTYVLAAAPVPSRGSDVLLTVPLASRQRELALELNALSARVLVGAILVVVLGAMLGAWLAGRVSDPVSRLSRATRQIAAGRLDVRIAATTSDELGALVDDFNGMTATLVAQRAALARTNQLKAWNEMARQVAHEIKNPLTPVQLAAEHLQHVHVDAHRPLGAVVDQCVGTILRQVKLLRQIASEFANFAGEPVSRPEPVAAGALVTSVLDPYRVGTADRVRFDVHLPPDLPTIYVDRTLTARALTNVVENAVQAMPSGGLVTVRARGEGGVLVLTIADTGVGMTADALGRAFEPYFSTKTAGSGLGLANAKRNLEREGGTIAMASVEGRGTTVTVTLPVAALPDGGASAPAPSR